MRLIDIEPVLKAAELAWKELVSIDLLKDLEQVDAVPVVPGRWLINSDGYYPYCSECKEEPKNGIMTHYCPNCGAKMDKGAKHETD